MENLDHTGGTLPSPEEPAVVVTRLENENIQEIKEAIALSYTTNRKDQGPISKPHFPEDYEERVQNKDIRLFVAKVNGEIAGSVQYESRDGTAYLSQMASLPAYRSQGIGRELLRAAEQNASQEGFETIQLTAMNEKGLPAYYENQGYVTIGTKERPTYTLTIMEKKLA